MSFTFRPLTSDDFDQLRTWHKAPHVAMWWDDEPIEETLADYSNYVEGRREEGLTIFIVVHEGQDIGMLQVYDAFAADDGWWPDEPEGTFGMDCFIGEPHLLEIGLGSTMVRQMGGELLAREGVTRLIIDPDPKNTRAIRAYEKAGYTQVGVIETPDGPSMLMEWRL